MLAFDQRLELGHVSSCGNYAKSLVRGDVFLFYILPRYFLFHLDALKLRMTNFIKLYFHYLQISMPMSFYND